ncbi:hypothetical protein ACIRCZ_11430 [Leifsonia sp. NPDC102414]|uniref:hypothetical protein n=1 Tax=Leifsonia sp. NPDC102414 TaxID=3364124 RepID=UPI003800E28A
MSAHEQGNHPVIPVDARVFSPSDSSPESCFVSEREEVTVLVALEYLVHYSSPDPMWVEVSADFESEDFDWAGQSREGTVFGDVQSCPRVSVHAGDLLTCFIGGEGVPVQTVNLFIAVRPPVLSESRNVMLKSG